MILFTFLSLYLWFHQKGFQGPNQDPSVQILQKGPVKSSLRIF
ncbi:hypothetical protein ACJW30_08G108300 [Castanea mollissima]